MRLAILAAAIVVLGASGAMQRAEADVTELRPGSELALERWNVELPHSARAIRGAPYSELVSTGDPSHVAVLLGLELSAGDTELLPSGLFDGELRIAGRAKPLPLDAAEAQSWLHRDATPLGSLQPRLPERVLIAWELPAGLDLADLRELRLSIHDEEFTAEGGPSRDDIWRLTGPTSVVELPVRIAPVGGVPA